MNLLDKISKVRRDDADDREMATQKVVDDSHKVRREATKQLEEAYRKAGLALETVDSPLYRRRFHGQ